MLDLSAELAGLAQSATAHITPDEDYPARIMVFVSPRTGSGTSVVAREFARQCAAKSRKGVMLVDLDFFTNGQFTAFSMPEMVRAHGPMGSAVSAAPEGEVFWRVAPTLVQPDGRVIDPARYLTVHQVGSTPLWLTRFHYEALRRDQRIQILHAPEYWNLMRNAADVIVIDAPPYERSKAGLTLARSADDVVLVVDENAQDDPLIQQMRGDMDSRGLSCTGVVLNRVRPAPAMRVAG